MPLILLGGISELATAERGLAAGFDFVAMARAILHHPDIVNEWAHGTGTVSGCIHCNRCMPTIYTGTRCPLVDPHPGDRPIEIPPWATDRPASGTRLGGHRSDRVASSVLAARGRAVRSSRWSASVSVARSWAPWWRWPLMKNAGVPVAPLTSAPATSRSNAARGVVCQPRGVTTARPLISPASSFR